MTSPQTDLNYRLTATDAGLERGMERGARSMGSAEKSALALERALAKEEARQARVDRSMTQVGQTMLGAGAAIALGLGLSVKAAIDWESAWAGVLKTVDGTDEQMAALEQEMRGLTAVLPASHAEIAAVAEAAGQLGVAREDVADFTRTMIDMGEATNLSSDEAATALARFMNIMQTAPSNVDRLASAIVDLGNKGATTESEITEMALRIAGAGRTIGLTEQQVLGFAAALSNVGIRAEAGGTAISKVFLEIDTAVSSGSDNLEVFARTAGMTADEFRQAYEQDAGAAIASFVAGLGRVQQSGGDVNAVLSATGLTEIRVSDALRRLAGSGNNLTTALEISNTAWEENTALAAEAERRYGTVEARMRIARNQVNDFAIDMGQTFLPVVGEMADKASALASVIGDLPAPVRTALGILAALTATILLAGGAALVTIPKIAALKASLDTLENSGGRTATTVGFLRRAVGRVPLLPLTGALGLATAALTVFALKQAETKRRVEEVSETLDQQTGAITENTRTWVAHELEQRGVLESADQLGLDLATVTDAILGETDALALVNDAVAEHDRRLKDTVGTTENYADVLREQGVAEEDIAEKVVRHNAELAKQDKAAEKVRDSVSGLTGDLERAADSTRRQAEASRESEAAMDDLDPATRALAEQFGIGADQAKGLAGEISDLSKELDELFSQLFDVEAAGDALTRQYMRLRESVEENGHALEANSEEALNNRDVMRAVIKENLDYIGTLAKSGANTETLRAETEALKQKFIEQMRQAGFSEEAIAEYAAAFDLIPEQVDTTFSAPGLLTVDQQMRNLKANIDAIPRRVGVTVTATVDSQRIAGLQHGGEVGGSMTAPPDSRIIAATPGEIVIRRDVAQANKAALLAFNETGRLPLAAASGGGFRGASAAAGGVAAGGVHVAHQDIHVTTLSAQYRHKQVMDDLAMHAAV